MKKVEFKDAPTYEAAGHFGCTVLRLQHKDLTGSQNFWVGLTHFLPKGGAEMAGGDTEKAYLVLAGNVTVKAESGMEFSLGPMDTLYIPPGEKRSILNKTNYPASMLVVASYSK